MEALAVLLIKPGCSQGLEGALTALKGQVATVEHNLQDDVSKTSGWWFLDRWKAL